MAPFLVQVSLQRISAMPEDVVVNTFHLISPGLAGWSEVITKIYDFFADVPTGETEQVGNYLATSIPRGAGHGHTIKVYDLADPLPRTPVYDEPDFFLGGSTPSTPNMPEEVAFVVSYGLDPVSGEPQARRRGRFYLGPLSTDALSEDAEENARPSTEFMSVVRKAAAQLFADDPDGPVWAVYSRVDDEARGPLDYVRTDNAWDTQRRRGPAATSRSTIVL